jgi:hypothetical protein
MAQPARKRSPRYPPDVIDINAPQFPLLDPKAHTPPHHHHTTTTDRRTPARPLTEDERQLAAELRTTWGVRGGRQLIRDHGFDAIAEAVALLRNETDVRHPARFLRWVIEIEAADEATG